jgi:hypothetical protein
MDEPIACPQCGAPAQITQRFWLASTADPVEHLVTAASTTTGSPHEPRPSAAPGSIPPSRQASSPLPEPPPKPMW